MNEPEASLKEPDEAVDEGDEAPATEANVLCCLSTLICGPTLDALTALPGVVLDDIPAALRTSSLVLCVLLGAPSLRKDAIGVLEQRAILGILLASVAFLGLNRAEVAARNADGVFSLVGTLAAILASYSNGVMQSDSLHSKKIREHYSSLCGGLIFYLGFRIVRHAFALPNEVTSFKVSHDDIETLGYAVAVDLVVVGNAFAGACSIGFACIVLLNHDLVFHLGSSAVASIAGTLACFVFLGAFAAQLASFGAMQELPALFSENSCDGDADECAAAYRARRLFIASNSTAVAWVCAIAQTIYAFAHSKRFRTRREVFEYEPSPYTTGGLSAIGCSLGAMLLVLLLSDSNASMDWSDIELLLLLASIPIALFHFTTTACLTHAAGQSLYIWTRFDLHGYYDFTYFTHHSLLATFVLTLLISIVSLFCYTLYSFGNRRLYSEPAEVVNAIALTSLVSVQTFLTLATLGMSAGYTGIYYEDAKGSWRITGFEFTVQHCISFFFAAALYATRYEPARLPSVWARAAWFALPPLLGLSWLLCILLLAVGDSPYQHFVDSTSFLVGISAAFVSWVGVGFALCL